MQSTNLLRALLSCHAAGEKGVYLDELLACLGKATEARLIVNLLEDAVLRKDNYARFFVRLGQGGTRLSDDELSYSLIKQSYPEVRDRIEEIVTGPGRFASDVDLVLGAVRVAQTLAPRPEMEKWAKAARPSPDQIRQLDEKGSATTKPYFLAMLPKEHDRPKKLKIALEQLCRGLQYDCDVNSSGLPTMLLARLPRDLLDVLLLFAFKRGELQTWEGNDKQTLIAFVLYWLMFVKDDAKGAYRTFEVLGRIEWQFSEHSVAALISLFEAASISRRAPRTPDWPDLEDEVQQRPCALAKWEERFTARDREEHPGPGESLRVMSTHSELIRRALIWIQRKYITDRFRNYDPTSTRDDDLPFDLDHAIPRFHFDSRRSDAKLIHLSPEDRVCFDNARNTVGDSLGNMRWLAAPDNRARGKGQIEEPPRVDDHIDRSPWNRLIDLTEWTADDVSTFQRLIDGRTLHLARCLLDEGGLTRLLGIADQPERSAMSGCDA